MALVMLIHSQSRAGSTAFSSSEKEMVRPVLEGLRAFRLNVFKENETEASLVGGIGPWSNLRQIPSVKKENLTEIPSPPKRASLPFL
jgi:hypothetical protein